MIAALCFVVGEAGYLAGGIISILIGGLGLIVSLLVAFDVICKGCFGNKDKGEFGLLEVKECNEEVSSRRLAW